MLDIVKGQSFFRKQALKALTNVAIAEKWNLVTKRHTLSQAAMPSVGQRRDGTITKTI